MLDNMSFPPRFLDGIQKLQSILPSLGDGHELAGLVELKENGEITDIDYLRYRKLVFDLRQNPKGAKLLLHQKFPFDALFGDYVEGGPEFEEAFSKIPLWYLETSSGSTDAVAGIGYGSQLIHEATVPDAAPIKILAKCDELLNPR